MTLTADDSAANPQDGDIERHRSADHGDGLNPDVPTSCLHASGRIATSSVVLEGFGHCCELDDHQAVASTQFRERSPTPEHLTGVRRGRVWQKAARAVVTRP